MKKYLFYSSKEQAKLMNDFAKDMEKRFLYPDIVGDKKRKERNKNRDNLKWAWIVVGKTRKMCWVDNKTGKAYKADGYDKTWMEIKTFKFYRWCTSFDL